MVRRSRRGLSPLQLREHALALRGNGFVRQRFCTMPELCRFLGLVVTMYFNDHNPPHFHARYEDSRAIIAIDPLELREGSLPPRVLGLVMEWARIHQAELVANWTALAERGMFERIAPLV
jgi:hypothetical protein